MYDRPPISRASRASSTTSETPVALHGEEACDRDRTRAFARRMKATMVSKRLAHIATLAQGLHFEQSVGLVRSGEDDIRWQALYILERILNRLAIERGVYVPREDPWVLFSSFSRITMGLQLDLPPRDGSPVDHRSADAALTVESYPLQASLETMASLALGFREGIAGDEDAHVILDRGPFRDAYRPVESPRFPVTFTLGDRFLHVDDLARLGTVSALVGHLVHAVETEGFVEGLHRAPPSIAAFALDLVATEDAMTHYRAVGDRLGPWVGFTRNLAGQVAVAASHGVMDGFLYISLCDEICAGIAPRLAAVVGSALPSLRAGTPLEALYRGRFYRGAPQPWRMRCFSLEAGSEHAQRSAPSTRAASTSVVNQDPASPEERASRPTKRPHLGAGLLIYLATLAFNRATGRDNVVSIPTIPREAWRARLAAEHRLDEPWELYRIHPVVAAIAGKSREEFLRDLRQTFVSAGSGDLLAIIFHKFFYAKVTGIEAVDDALKRAIYSVVQSPLFEPQGALMNGTILVSVVDLERIGTGVTPSTIQATTYVPPGGVAVVFMTGYGEVSYIITRDPALPLSTLDALQRELDVLVEQTIDELHGA